MKPRYIMLLLSVLLASIPIAAAQQAPDSEGQNSLSLERVVVTGLKPGSAEAEPGGQILTRDPDTNLPAISDWLKNSVAGVTFSEPQGNPFQPELSYRGYGVSGLLGLPQGLAFFQNGVRVNEAFGDVVNFDMFPEIAVDRLSIISGANPLFGHNALGGAVASTMKTGFNFGQNGAGEVSGGSFGRFNIAGESGYKTGPWGFYGAIEYSEDDGWRDQSPSEVLRVYGDLERQFERGRVGLSITWADAALNGNGAVPEELFDARPESVFTYPDTTLNDALFIQSRADWLLLDNLEISGEAHYRRYNQNTINGDESDLGPCPDGYTEGAELVCSAEETDLDALPTQNPNDDGVFYAFNDEGEIAGFELATNIDGGSISVNNITDGDAEFGVFNRSGTLANSGGFSTQLSWQPETSYVQEATLGLVYEHSSVRFSTEAELGVLTDTRSVDARGIFLGAENADEDVYNIGLITYNHTWNLFGGAAFNIIENLDLQISANVNGANIILEDQRGDALNGNHSYVAFNPAIELSYQPPDIGLGSIKTFTRYAQSNRVPSPAELACSDENRPCRFPNAFVADPPLDQVKVHSVEFGISGSKHIYGGALDWSLAGYYSLNQRDILFISAGETIGSGYFDNVGNTQRAGFESLVRYQHEWFTLAASYAYIDATFQTGFDLFSENHPMANDDGEIPVESGDKIPLIPAHSGYISATIHTPSPPMELVDQVSAEFRLHMASERYFRGDEGNLADPLPGFTRLDLNLEAIFVRNISLFINFENLTNARYATFGTFGEGGELALSELGTDEDDQTNYGSRFITPAAPFAVYAGIRASF